MRESVTQYLIRFRSGVIAAMMLLVAVALLPADPTGRPTPPKPKSGVIDLSSWNFGAHGTVSLSGDWRFAKGAGAALPGAAPVYFPVPGYWSRKPADRYDVGPDNFGVYSLRLTLPDAPGIERFAIDTGYWQSAYRIYANGQLLVESGNPSASAALEIANAYSRVATLPEHAKVVDLRIEVSNHLNLHGGSFVAPFIGLETSVRYAAGLMRGLSTFLVGAMFFAALYHLVLYFLDRSAPANLWFAIFAALLCVRSLTIAPLAILAHSLIGQDWVWRIDFASSMLLLPACYQFFLASFPRQISASLSPLLWVVFPVLALLTLALGPVTGEIGMKVLETAAVPFIAYLCVSLGRAALMREQGAVLALTGWMLCAVASLHDILMDNMLISSVSLIPFGFLAFFLCTSGMLAARFQNAFRLAQDASRQLQRLNDELEAAVESRTSELHVKLDELKRNQDELVRAREVAVSANAAKSRFLATMSHELRTPLNSILGFSEIIRDERLGQLGDARYGEYASYINESGAHLLSLIGDILDLSRIESGTMDLHVEPVSVEELAHAAMRRAATRERRALEAVTLHIDPALPLLLVDRRALTQMLINLISNALKFTPADGKITVSAFLRNDGGMTVDVADTGIGMATEDIPKAMLAFTQVDDNLSRRHEGSGLGLAIVKSLMEQHGGSIGIRSTRGVGTTVSLAFPASRVAGGQAPDVVAATAF